MNSSDDFSITFTLSPTLYKYNTDIQYTLSQEAVYRVLNSLDSLDYIVSTEVTKDNNIHYHVYIVFKEIFKLNFMRKRIKRLLKDELQLGFFQIKATYDKENWLRYIHKNPYIQKAPNEG